MVIPGFLFSGVAAGIKKQERKDMGLIYSETPAAAAGVFTRNWIKAAPVYLTQKRLASGYLQMVLANSGCANACTGRRGMKDADLLTSLTARKLGISPDLAAMASTGVIGEFLPLRRMRDRLTQLCGEIGEEKIDDFAHAIITTDTVTKVAFREEVIDGKRIVIGGIAKGAGMINPSLATMLAFIVTNAAVSPKTLQALLTEGVSKSFNRITVDGDTSTNDSVLLLANGQARNRPFSRKTAAHRGFTSMLFAVMEDLAHMIVQDGEGATKVVEIRVQKARSRIEAETITRSIACSPLVKTAFYGEEANWGRIISAAGKTKFPIDFGRLELFINSVPLVRKGRVLSSTHERHAQREMSDREFSVTLVLNQGEHEFSMYTTDYSPQYVTINAGYKS